MSDMRLERLAGKTGLIKPHLVVAEATHQSHIGSGRTAFQFRSSSAGTALPGSEGRDGLDRVVRRRPHGSGLGDRPQKYTEGFTRLIPSVLTLACMAGSILLLGLALKALPIGTAYAVWTGIGAVGTAILGIALFGEPATAARLACIGLIVAGIVGLKLVSGSA
jgi:quaternary ammonium compound-resistance protein SugE